jgi:hypothetical protein
MAGVTQFMGAKHSERNLCNVLMSRIQEVGKYLAVTQAWVAPCLPNLEIHFIMLPTANTLAVR